MQERDYEGEELAAFPYTVVHEEMSPADVGVPQPKFKTWGEALAAQVKWNKDVPGHKAVRRHNT
tara:strand:- start:193 stop:384 length:192 start_codon:yes stop_codon:yes gene_type:complete